MKYNVEIYDKSILLTNQEVEKVIEVNNELMIIIYKNFNIEVIEQS